MSDNPKARYSRFQSHMRAQVSTSSVFFFFSGAIFGQRNWESFVFLDMMGMVPFKCKCLDSSYHWACLCLFISSKREVHTQIAVVNGCLLVCVCHSCHPNERHKQVSSIRGEESHKVLQTKRCIILCHLKHFVPDFEVVHFWWPINHYMRSALWAHCLTVYSRIVLLLNNRVRPSENWILRTSPDSIQNSDTFSITSKGFIYWLLNQLQPERERDIHTHNHTLTHTHT